MLKKNNIITPYDPYNYSISSDVVAFTETILAAYGEIRPSNEGMVYWAGRRNGYTIDIKMAIAPATISSRGRVEVTPLSNLNVILELSKHHHIHIGQVHSHPTNWVGHSDGDDLWAAFKYDGL